MTQIDSQLVKMIADQVMAAMNLRRDHSHDQVAVQPPVGVCTGDYSKFQGLEINSPKSEIESPKTEVSKRKIFSGFVTADDLSMQLAKQSDHIIILEHTARLTPLAQDYVKEKQVVIQRDNIGNKSPANHIQVAGKPFAWWTESFCPVVQKLRNSYSKRVHSIGAAKKIGEIDEVLKQIDQQIARDEVAGGILFVEDAAKATLFANKCANIRAIFSRCSKSFATAKRELGINLLIVEYRYTPANEIELLVHEMMSGVLPPTPIVDKQLSELSTLKHGR